MITFLLMSRLKEIPVGTRFGKLTVLNEPGFGTKVTVQCDCGKPPYAIWRGSLRSGNSTQCKGCAGGIQRRKDWEKRNPGIPMRQDCPLVDSLNTRFYQARGRCNNPRHQAYRDYGGRGIEFRFDSFFDYYTHVTSLPGCGEPGLTIDRIDNDGHYEVGNLRWATVQQQGENTRRTLQPEAYGIQWASQKALARELGVRHSAIIHHRNKGRSWEQILDHYKFIPPICYA